MTTGWARVHRQLTESDFWLSEPFTKPQAWVDLIVIANHKQGSFWVRGIEVELKRGQIGRSELTLAKRWKWSRNKVRGYLKTLQTQNMIQQKKSTLTSVITIVNYEKYQTKVQQAVQQKVQQKDNRRYTNKNVKNDKNVKKIKKERENPQKEYSSLKCIKNKEILLEIAKKYSVPLPFVRVIADRLENWCEANGKRYKNYKRALMNWVSKDSEKLRKEASYANSKAGVDASQV